ncbi:MAG: formimidoylglutamate deiminase [Williamsia herbipolensis]|nr:formimidoylglutamate deiminase [Williamsia herbipolensis]
MLRCAEVCLPTGTAADVDLTVLDGVITGIGPADRTATGSAVESLPGLVFPGFADAHSHVFHRALRGRTHVADDTGNFWTWREGMYAVAAALDLDSLFELATAAFCELLCAGYTAVGEFHYLHHRPDGARYDDPNAMGLALVEAAREVGIGLTLLDTVYLAAGFGDPPLHPVQRRFTDGSVMGWAERVADLHAAAPPDVRIGAAVHSVRAVPTAALREMSAALDEVDPGRLLHVHLSEQPQENADALRATGRTPTGLLHEAGLLGPATAVVHATHLTDRDVALLGESGSTAVICPSTEADLADGLPRIADLVAARVPLACGGDQQVLVDPFHQARGIEWGERLRTGRRGTLAPADLVAAATAASHRSIDSVGGAVAVGMPADLVCVRTDSARTAGSRSDQLVMTATSADVVRVLRGGRTVVSDGVHHALGEPGVRLARFLTGNRPID